MTHNMPPVHPNTLPSEANNPSPRTDRPVFSATAIHETFAASILAKEAMRWLEHSLFDMEVRSNFWSFQSLESPDARSVSFPAAATSHALIIAASDTMAVPEHIKGWLDTTFQQQEEGARAVLVVLHGTDGILCDEPRPLCSSLEQQANRWQTSCLCNHAFDEQLDRDYALKLISQNTSEPKVRQPSEATPIPHGGQKLINTLRKAFTFLSVLGLFAGSAGGQQCHGCIAPGLTPHGTGEPETLRVI